jgi:hypothetical protein
MENLHAPRLREPESRWSRKSVVDGRKDHRTLCNPTANGPYMEKLRLVARISPGIICSVLGIVHIWWVGWLLGNSLHLGSPLRMNARYVSRSLTDAAIKKQVDYMVDVGQLGFDLLGRSMWVHFSIGLAMIFLGIGIVLLLILVDFKPITLARQNQAQTEAFPEDSAI